MKANVGVRLVRSTCQRFEQAAGNTSAPGGRHLSMTSYTIRSGDTLSSIASRYQTSVAALARANSIANPNVIYAGRTLEIPDG